MAPPPSDDIRHHERFYFSDGSLYLLVERSLYRVHRSLFEMHASKFPACGLDTSGGETCILNDVKKIDFDRLLACLYPRALFVEEAKSTEEWISILNLASKWGFESLQSRARSKIEHTLASPVDMVVFGRQYNISDILYLGYATLCQGTAPLSSEEGRRLGVDDVVNIYRIRHELYGSVVIPVSIEQAFEKVRIFLSNEEHEDGNDLEAKRADPNLDGEQSGERTDAGSVATSPKSLAEVISLPADSHGGTDGSDDHAVESLYPDPASQTPPAEKDKEMVNSVSSERTDAGSIAASPKSLVEEEVSLPADSHAGTDDSDGHAGGSLDTNLAPQTSPADKDKETVDSASNTSAGAERPEDQPGLVSEQEQSDNNTECLQSEMPLDAPPSVERPVAQEDPGSEEEQFDELGSPTLDASSSRSGNIPTITSNDVHVPESSGSAGPVFRFLDELSTKNLDCVTKNILQWFKASSDSQILYQITQLIVEKAIAEQPGQFDVLVCLCKKMVKRLSGNVQSNDSKRSGGLVFLDYLGDICRENLKAIGASTIAAGEHTAEIRRLRLIEFIGRFVKLKGMDMWTPAIINKWVAALLDTNDEEKVATLCMLMARVGPPWDNSSKKKLRAHINRWFQEMNNVAKKTSKPRVRTLLQDVIRCRNLGWVAGFMSVPLA